MQEVYKELSTISIIQNKRMHIHTKSKPPINLSGCLGLGTMTEKEHNGNSKVKYNTAGLMIWVTEPEATAFLNKNGSLTSCLTLETAAEAELGGGVRHTFSLSLPPFPQEDVKPKWNSFMGKLQRAFQT